MRFFHASTARRTHIIRRLTFSIATTLLIAAGAVIYLSSQTSIRADALSLAVTFTPTPAPRGALPTTTRVLPPVTTSITYSNPSATPVSSPTSLKAPPSTATPTRSAVATSAPALTRSFMPPVSPIATKTSTPQPTVKKLSAPGSAPAVNGHYQLAGRTTHTGTTITASPGGYTATTAADGSFSLPLSEGTYTITASTAGYLPTSKVNVVVSSGATTTLADATAVSGDADGNGAVDLSDLSIIGGVFGLSSSTDGYDARADLNADGSVNIIDLVLAASHYGMSGAQTWP